MKIMPRGRPKKKQEVEEYTEKVLESGQEEEIEEFDWKEEAKKLLPKGYNGPAFLNPDGELFWMTRDSQGDMSWHWLIFRGDELLRRCGNKQSATAFLLTYCVGLEYRRIQ
jgi:hypothetical protein